MEVTTISLSKIKRSDKQPRKYFDEGSIKELSESIKKDGLMQPITVRKVSRDTFEIVQGERRYRACKLAGLSEIPAIIKELDDEEAFHLSVIENIQREDMTPIEEAKAFQEYVEMGYTHAEIAKKVSKSRTYVTSSLRLLKLNGRILGWINDGKLSEGHAKQILRMESIVDRLFGENSIAIGTPFEYIQDRFCHEFWMDLDEDKKSISVKEIIEWGDRWHYSLINSVVLHFYGQGQTDVGDVRGMPVTSELECKLYDLHISRVIKSDIDFMKKRDLKEMKDDFDEKLRPWMIEKFWDDVEMDLFHTRKDINKRWSEPLKGTSLNEYTKAILQEQQKLEATLYLFAEMFHKFADENSLERLTNRELADRFMGGNEYEVYSLEELEVLFKEVQQKEFPAELLESLKMEISKKVSRDTNMSWEELRQ